MEEIQSLMTYLEQITEDCCDHFKRCEVGEEVYRGRANGDDAGYVEDTEEEITEDARPD
jgi:hypothetical protein